MKINKKKYGFTLIELLAVIIILAVIALIAVPQILKILTNVRKHAAEDSALGYISAIETKAATSIILEEKEYENKEDYVYDEIEVVVSGKIPTAGIYSLQDNIITNGVFCINGYTVNYDGEKAVATTKCKAEDLKLTGIVKLSSSSGTYEYPNSGEVEIIENKSGGNLSCKSEDEEVATCSISRTTMTVTPGVKKGSTTITVTSAATSKYNEAASAYVATTEEGLLSYTANNYTGIYDGEEHGISIVVENAIVKYGTEEGNDNLEQTPKYSEVGEYTVYYEIIKAGYETVRGNKKITINKADGSIVAPTPKVLGYTGSVQTLINAGSTNTGIIEYKLGESGTYSEELPSAINVGTYEVYYKVVGDSNHKDVAEDYIEVSIGKGTNTLRLSSSNGTITYPEETTIEVIENISGGNLSCETLDSEVATCSITGTTMTVKPGTKKGNTTITVKSGATINYNASQVAYLVTTEEGLLSYTANNYSGIYDGLSHGITVTSEGATIKYGESEGIYTETNPTYINVGEYTVYYEIIKAGYETVRGNKKITISKADGSVTAPTAKTLKYNGGARTLINAGSSTTGTIQYKLGESGTYSENLPSATDVGTYTVYYKVIGDSNHNNVAENSIEVTISPGTINATATGYTGEVDGVAHGITVTVSSPAGTTIRYRTTSSGTYNLTENPTYTTAGTYTVYYQVTKEGYTTVTGSKTVSLENAVYTVTFNAGIGSVYSTSKQVTNRSKYGTLPTPSISDTCLEFRGWYTSPSGGELIRADTTVSLTGNQTLYAQYSTKRLELTTRIYYNTGPYCSSFYIPCGTSLRDNGKSDCFASYSRGELNGLRVSAETKLYSSGEIVLR